MKDIVERIDESFEKQKLEELKASTVGKAVAGAAVGAAALANPLAAAGVLGGGFLAGKAVNAFLKLFSGDAKLTRAINSEYIQPHKKEIARNMMKAFIQEPTFTTSLIGMGSTLNSIKDKKLKRDLAEIFFVFLTLHNEKGGTFFKKGISTLMKSGDADIAAGAKEGQKQIKSMLGG